MTPAHFLTAVDSWGWTFFLFAYFQSSPPSTKYMHLEFHLTEFMILWLCFMPDLNPSPNEVIRSFAIPSTAAESWGWVLISLDWQALFPWASLDFYMPSRSQGKTKRTSGVWFSGVCFIFSGEGRPLCHSSDAFRGRWKKKTPVKWNSEQTKHVKCSLITLQEDESPQDLSCAAGPRVGINQNRTGKRLQSLLWNSAVRRVACPRRQPPVTKWSSSCSSQPLSSHVAGAEAKGFSLASCPLSPRFPMKTGFSVFTEVLCLKDCTLCAFCFCFPKSRLQGDH